MYALGLSISIYRVTALASMVLATIAAAGCRTAGSGSGATIVQPGAPGQSSRVITAEKAVDLSRVQHTAADVEFMQGMIGHHAQALEMTALLAVQDAERGHAQAGAADRGLAVRRDQDDAASGSRTGGRRCRTSTRITPTAPS